MQGSNKKPSRHNDENSRIRIRIHANMSWIHNTGSNSTKLFRTRTRSGRGWVAKSLEGWVAKSVARHLTTAALWVRIQTSLKNHKWATSQAKEWPTHSSAPKKYTKKRSGRGTCRAPRWAWRRGRGWSGSPAGRTPGPGAAAVVACQIQTCD
jgi:hypothetical protein